LDTIQALFGGAFATLNLFLEQDADGELGMVIIFHFGMKIGLLMLSLLNQLMIMICVILVSDLMKNDSKEWNVRRISAMFDQHSVARILATPLYPAIIDDRRLWHGESKGDYSVKSAYNLYVQDLIDTSHLRVNGNWNLV
jgi:hypothetical protein